MIVLVMGVAGSGKTTVGQALAKQLGARFLEGDAFHTPANRSKMGRGIPLTDEDRGPWLEAIREAMVQAAGEGEPVVVACSALKHRYRRRLTAGVVLPPGSFTSRWIGPRPRGGCAREKTTSCPPPWPTASSRLWNPPPRGTRHRDRGDVARGSHRTGAHPPHPGGERG